MTDTNQLIELIGYLAMILVAMAMVFSSILKLRWFSLVGSALFTIYGFTIGAYPVGAVNGFIMITNMVFLIKMYAQKESFKTLEIDITNKYLKHFLEFHSHDILKFFPGFNPENHYTTAFLILRDMQVAGVFLAEEKNNKLHIKLDYVTPQYRDFKPGDYIYNQQQGAFKEKGITHFVSERFSNAHDKYLMKLGFENSSESSGELLLKKIV